MQLSLGYISELMQKSRFKITLPDSAVVTEGRRADQKESLKCRLGEQVCVSNIPLLFHGAVRGDHSFSETRLQSL